MAAIESYPSLGGAVRNIRLTRNTDKCLPVLDVWLEQAKPLQGDLAIRFRQPR
jgi:hypothetical protein